MKREEIREKIPGITPEALDWLMSCQGQEIEQHRSDREKLEAALARLEEQDKKLADYDPDWKEKARREGVDARLSAAIQQAGGRSETAIRALLDLEELHGAEDPAASIPAALDRLKAGHGYLFAQEAPASYSGGVGTAAGGGEDSSALRAAFGLA